MGGLHCAACQQVAADNYPGGFVVGGGGDDPLCCLANAVEVMMFEVNVAEEKPSHCANIWLMMVEMSKYPVVRSVNGWSVLTNARRQFVVG